METVGDTGVRTALGRGASPSGEPSGRPTCAVVIPDADYRTRRRSHAGLRPPRRGTPRRLALALFALWFVVVSSPLANVLYPRMAGLAVLGLIVLAAIGGSLLVEDPARFRRAGLLPSFGTGLPLRS